MQNYYDNSSLVRTILFLKLHDFFKLITLKKGNNIDTEMQSEIKETSLMLQSKKRDRFQLLNII